MQGLFYYAHKYGVPGGKSEWIQWFRPDVVSLWTNNERPAIKSKKE